MEALAQSTGMLAPWALGYALALVAHWAGFFSAATTLVIGGIASAVSVIFFPVMFMQFTAHWIHAENLLGGRLVLCTAAMVFVLGLVRCGSWVGRLTKKFLLAMTMLGLVVLVAVTLSTVVPLQSWDGVDYWALKGMEFAEHLRTRPDSPYLHESRHPITVSALLAYSSQMGKLASNGYVVISAWALLAASNIAIIFGAALALTKNIHIAAVSSLLYATIPLIENHTSLYGYAELPITTMILASTALFLCGSIDNQRFLWILGCLCAATCVALKNTGGIYMTIPVIGALFSLLICLWTAKVRVPLISSTLTLVPLFSLLAMVLFFMYLGASSYGVFFFGGYYLAVQDQSVSQVFEILYAATVSNASFQICGLMIFLGILSLFRRPMPMSCDISDIVCITTMLTGVLVGILTLFVDYMAPYSSPGSDTSFSRFLIPILSLTPLVFASIAANLRNGTRVPDL